MLDKQEQQARLLGRLMGAVERLASPADAQIAHLESLGVGVGDCADELALELDDVAEAAIAVPGLTSPAQAAAVRTLLTRLGEMSGPEKAELWTGDALRSAPEWVDIRDRARTALQTFQSPGTSGRTDAS
jgi:hypothetical protein